MIRGNAVFGICVSVVFVMITQCALRETRFTSLSQRRCDARLATARRVSIRNETKAEKVTSNHHTCRSHCSRTNTRASFKSAFKRSLFSATREHERTIHVCASSSRFSSSWYFSSSRERRRRKIIVVDDGDDGDDRDGKIKSRNRLAVLPSDVYLGETVFETSARENKVETRGFSAIAGKLVVRDKRGTV